MSYADFQKAWVDAVVAFKNGDLSLDELMEYGSLDEFMDYFSDDELENETEVSND